jgi:phosphoribosylanthranilate isomerase
MYLFDSYDGARHGGTGRAFDWSFLRGLSLPAPFLLSGGLDPENVRTAVRVAKPFGVDVSSGVEIRPGVKDLRRMRSFVRAAKGL